MQPFSLRLPNFSFTITLWFWPSPLLLCPSSALCSNLRARPRGRGHAHWGLGLTQWKGGAPDLKQRVVQCWCVADFKKWERQAAGVWCEGSAEARCTKQVFTPGANGGSDTLAVFTFLFDSFLFLHFDSRGTVCLLFGACGEARGDGAVINRRSSVCSWVNNKEESQKGKKYDW